MKDLNKGQVEKLANSDYFEIVKKALIRFAEKCE